MEYKIGQVLDVLPESAARQGNFKISTFILDDYATKLTAQPNKWVVLDTLDDLDKSKFYTRVANYNKKYNSKGFEFARIVSQSSQIFLGKYNPSLLK